MFVDKNWETDTLLIFNLYATYNFVHTRVILSTM
jgi:hypothetical protein